MVFIPNQKRSPGLTPEQSKNISKSQEYKDAIKKAEQLYPKSSLSELPIRKLTATIPDTPSVHTDKSPEIRINPIKAKKGIGTDGLSPAQSEALANNPNWQKALATDKRKSVGIEGIAPITIPGEDSSEAIPQNTIIEEIPQNNPINEDLNTNQNDTRPESQTIYGMDAVNIPEN